MGLSQKSLARIKKYIFVQGSYESLRDWKAKLERAHFFNVPSDRITVCIVCQLFKVGWKVDTSNFVDSFGDLKSLVIFSDLFYIQYLEHIIFKSRQQSHHFFVLDENQFCIFFVTYWVVQFLETFHAEGHLGLQFKNNEIPNIF